MEYTEKHWNNLKRSSRFDYLLELAFLITNAQNQGKAPRGERPWDRLDNNFSSIYGKAKHLYCDTRAIRDIEVLKFLKEYDIDFYDVHQDLDQQKALEDIASAWTSKHITLNKHMHLIPMASTQSALIEFLMKNNNRQARIHKEEYWNKSQLAHFNCKAEYYIDPKDIGPNDAVVVTLPLHGTFEVPTWINEMFIHCSKIGVPVFVDCCWAWLQHDFNVNLEYECIDTVTCTLGKLFPIEGFRCGFKYTKNINNFDTNYSTNKIGTQLLIDLMNKFPADYIVQKYKPLQDFWCGTLGLRPTNSVHNCFCGDDLLWYSEHRALAQDGVNQNVFCLIPLFENHELITKYLIRTNQDRQSF